MLLSLLALFTCALPAWGQGLIVRQPVLRTADTHGTQTRPNPEKSFGDMGVWVLGGNFGVNSVSYSSSQASNLDISFAPEVDRFEFKRLSVGVYALYENGHSKSYDYFGPLIEVSKQSYGVGLRFGFDVMIAKVLSVWPAIALGYRHNYYDVSSSGSHGSVPALAPIQIQYTITATSVEAQLPFIVHLAPHVFARMGPSVYTDLNQTYDVENAPSVSNKRTGLLLSAGIGAWL
jgi:hypothetical protein